MLKPIGWCCSKCGAVYETMRERDMCARIHGEEEDAMNKELDEINDPNQ